MALPLSTAIQTSLRKYRRKKIRTFFGIAPTVLLFVFIVLLSGLAVSVDIFVRERVLSKIEQKEAVIDLNRAHGGSSGTPPQADPRSDTDDPTAYSAADIAKAKQVTHVTGVEPARPLPNVFAVTSDLIPNKQLHITDLVGASSDLATLYNAKKDFTYQPGQPIPIIMSRNIFNYQYLDFGGKTDITASGKDAYDPVKVRDLNPAKSEFLAREYNKQNLLGKTFSVTLGGLPPVPSYSDKTSFNNSGPTDVYHKFSAAELAAELKTQRDKVSPYWNVDALQKGVTLTFKVVGFNESLDNSIGYIPVPASTVITQQLYGLQRAARTKTVMPDDAYAGTFTGLRLSKTGQVSSAANVFNIPLEQVPVQRIYDNGPVSSVSTIEIPGWLYQFTPKNNASAPSEVAEFTYKPEAFAVKALAVTIDDAGNRLKVQQSLSSGGFPEATDGISFTGILRGIRSGINGTLLTVVIVLTIINSLILMSVVGRTVADAQREIGVFRALGARKRDIRKMYIVYSALQTALGIGAGLLLGLILVVPLSSFLARQAQKFLPTDAATGTYMGFDLKISPSDLQHVDWEKILLYSVALLLVTVIVSLLPAAKAARISPVEAIRRAD